MNYKEFLQYVKSDGSPEERMVAKLCKHYSLNKWDTFKVIYYYTMCYNIVDPFRLLKNPALPKSDIEFVSDRRYVRCLDNFERLKSNLTPDKLIALETCKTTSALYAEVKSWFFFGRYTTYLFLECWCYLYYDDYIDDFMPAWKKNELYTKGAMHIAQCDYNAECLNEWCRRAKKDSGETAFCLETALCGIAKILKGTRYIGYYTERLISYAMSYSEDPRFGSLILKLL